MHLTRRCYDCCLEPAKHHMKVRRDALLNDGLSSDECAELMERVRRRLQPLTIVDPVTIIDPVTEVDTVTGLRTSLDMFLRAAESPLVAKLDRRLAEVVNVPLENAEGAGSPQRGHAVYFEYSTDEGELKVASLHASSAVLQGEQWVATKRMRARRFVSA
jgi:hypothetical protein